MLEKKSNSFNHKKYSWKPYGVIVIDAYRDGIPVVFFFYFSNAKQALMSWLNTDVINCILQTLKRKDASTNNREIVKTCV